MVERPSFGKAEYKVGKAPLSESVKCVSGCIRLFGNEINRLKGKLQLKKNEKKMGLFGVPYFVYLALKFGKFGCVT